MNTWMNDPISFQPMNTPHHEERVNCGLCNVEHDESQLTEYEGYQACPDCIEKEGEMKKEVPSWPELIVKARVNERLRTINEIYNLPEIQGDQFIELRLKILSMTK